MTVADYPTCPLTRRKCFSDHCPAKHLSFGDLARYYAGNTAMTCSTIKSVYSQMKLTTKHRGEAKRRDA